jgi:hypothetical protein
MLGTALLYSEGVTSCTEGQTTHSFSIVTPCERRAAHTLICSVGNQELASVCHQEHTLVKAAFTWSLFCDWVAAVFRCAFI